MRIERVTEATIEDWRHVHNTIIPTAPLSADDVRERLGRNELEVAYRDDVLVGCTTVRPPVDGTATVIVRVLAAERRRGHGAELHARALARAAAMGAATVETIVLATNVDGVRFAEAYGYVEVDRYLLDGDEIPFITLRRT
jgi:GNAT superfamily N-acetyltransferase